MKLSILAGVAALALAGTAVGQPSPGVAWYGNGGDNNGLQQTQGEYGMRQSNIAGLPALNAQQQAEAKVALHSYKLACEADRVALCADKKGAPADRCLVYHKLRLSSSCKSAMDNLIVARRG